MAWSAHAIKGLKVVLTKYIFKDIIRVQLVSLAVLFVVFMSQTIIRLLSQATSGSIPVGIVSEMVLYSMPQVCYILLPMTLYIGIIVSLSRMSSDSEMVVMRSTGFSGVNFMKIAMVIATFTAAVTAYNCLVLMPKANYQQKLLTQNSQNDPRYFPLESGRFIEFGDYSVYIQKVSDEKSTKVLTEVYVIKNMFKNLLNNNQTEFMIARNGHLRTDDRGVQWIVLENGTLYSCKIHEGGLDKTTFRTLSIPIPTEKEQVLTVSDFRNYSTSDLLKSDDLKAKVEFQWRIAPIFACFIMAMIAIPL
ncbi:MAG: LPS export ABC transporter permease LptF, partial [Succinivibrio sp.]